MARPVVSLKEGWEIIDPGDGIQRVVVLMRDMRDARPFTPTEYADAGALLRYPILVGRSVQQLAPATLRGNHAALHVSILQ